MTSADIDWIAGEPPRSRAYGDVYFSRDDGLAEARAVFLDGCGLPEAWAERFDHLLEALRRGHSVEELRELTHIDPWFLRELQSIAIEPEATFSGQRTFKSVDTCAAEFSARTPYFYSSWERFSDGAEDHEVDRGRKRAS